mgnify:CR=1 FL=1
MIVSDQFIFRECILLITMGISNEGSKYKGFPRLQQPINEAAPGGLESEIMVPGVTEQTGINYDANSRGSQGRGFYRTPTPSSEETYSPTRNT